MTNQATIPVIATKRVSSFVSINRATGARWMAIVDEPNHAEFAFGKTERDAYARLVRQILVGA